MGIQSLNLENAQSIGGWMSNHELQLLAELASNATNILEVGCHLGRSTMVLADNTKGIVTAVDPWADIYYDLNNQPMNILGTGCYEKFLQNLTKHIAAKKVIPTRCYSHEFHPHFKFDFIFLDGDHRYEAVRNDILMSLSWLADGGILAGHDYGHSTWPGVKQAVDEMFDSQVEVIGTIWKLKF